MIAMACLRYSSHNYMVGAMCTKRWVTALAQEQFDITSFADTPS